VFDLWLNMLFELLEKHWLASALILMAMGLLAWGLASAGRRLPWLVTGVALALVGGGGLQPVPEPGGLAILLSAAGALVALVLLLTFTGLWSDWLGYFVCAVLLFGVGHVSLLPLTEGLNELARIIFTLEPLEPWWLVLLLLIPWLVWYSWRRLAALGPGRRVLAIALRCLLITLLAFALAEMHARHTEQRLTVLFLWDRSLSVPPEYDDAGNNLREQRIKDFINESVVKRGPGKENDRVGLVVFGRQPRLELPPGAVPQLRFQKIQSRVDDTYTDIAAAIKLALASFPEGSAKRIVLISDGNENLGNAEEQARIAKQNGVEIDVVPIAGGKRNPNEVLVERLDVPAITEKDSRLPLRVLLRSFNPQIVVGKLQLYKISLGMKKGDEKKDVPVIETRPVQESIVKLKYGLQGFNFSQPGATKDDAFVYEVKFVPTHVENDRGIKILDGFPGDRVENNRASAGVMARGQRTVLLMEPDAGDHKLLADRLRAVKSSLKVVPITVHPERSQLPQNAAELAMVLSKFDAIVIANVPADYLTDTQQKVIRSLVHDQGVGLIMIGGPQGYGAGGWQNTEIEKALPLISELKSMKIEGKSGLVLIMHASEMAEGNAWQRKIAKLAIEKLSQMDMIGQIHFDHQTGRHEWHIPFQQIAGKRNQMMNLVDTMMPGDMPDVDPALLKCYDALTNPLNGLGTKHIILISDGDHWRASPALLAKIGMAGVTMTTVCITTHGKAEIDMLAAVAAMVRTPKGEKGRSYNVTDPSELPAIYIKETRLVSQAFTHEKMFPPRLLEKFGPTEGIEALEPLHGFNRTTRRSSPLVTVAIETPKIGEYKFPVLAHWQYGLGKSIAFTSDARTIPGGKTYWDRDWANAPLYTKIWEQSIDWVLRAVESGKNMQIHTEHRDGKIRVTIEANDAQQRPLTDLKFKSAITSPSFKGPEGQRKELRFEQKNSGVYETEFGADEVGSYFINVMAEWEEGGKKMSDGIRAGVTIPYSPEFAEMESNPALLEKIRQITGGQHYAEDAAALARAAQTPSEVFRAMPMGHLSLQPLWHWLVALAGAVLLLDVAVRRIAFEPTVVWTKGVAVWERLRGREPVTTKADAFMERLKSRKAQVGESIEKEKAQKRFEATAGATPIVSDAGATGMTQEQGKPKPPPPPKPGAKPKEAEDYATRLMKAKKRALEDRDKEKGN